MYEDIKKNKMKTVAIVFGFLTMITLIIYYICPLILIFINGAEAKFVGT